MCNYIIKKADKEGYDRFLLWLSIDSLADHLDNVEDSLNKLNASGKILIDQLFLTGNEDNRFMSCYFKNGGFDFSTACNVTAAESFREETMQWLHDNYAFVENSILTKNQRQRIREGVVF